jgi:hypothetical protein
MIRNTSALFLIGVFIFTACSPTSNELKTPNPGEMLNGSTNQENQPETDPEPLAPLLRTLEIERNGTQFAGDTEIGWHITGSVVIEISLDSLASKSSPHLAKITFRENALQEGKIPFSATGEGQGNWQFLSGSCTGGGQFGLTYEVYGDLDPDSGAIDLNLIEKWTGGTSSTTCNGVGGSEEIPPGEITLNPIKMGICKAGDDQKENTWVQHPEASGGITWVDKFKLEDKYEQEADRVADQVMRLCNSK